jgi:DNA-binding MarR family transcriptional regulator
MADLSISEFADKINSIVPVVMREFARSQLGELYKDKITLPQFLILEFLHSEDESKMTSMAQFMRVSTAAMTGLVDRLVKYGYVIRIPDPKDRRIIKVKLTVKGNGLLKKINEQRHRTVIKIFGRLSEQDQRDYLRILTQIKDTLIEESAKIK